MTASKTITQILNAAGEIFAEKGFKNATVREICTKAGVNLAAVNYHFGDKERLYIEAVKNARHVLEENVPLPDDLDSREPHVALKVMIQTLARRMLNRDIESWRHGLLVREFTNPSKACEEMMQESIVPFMSRLHDAIRQLLPREVPEYTVHQLGLSIISQIAYYRLQDRVVGMLVPENEFNEHFSAEVLANHIARFSIGAIRAYDSVDSFCET